MLLILPELSTSGFNITAGTRSNLGGCCQYWHYSGLRTASIRSTTAVYAFCTPKNTPTMHVYWGERPCTNACRPACCCNFDKKKNRPVASGESGQAAHFQTAYIRRLTAEGARWDTCKRTTAVCRKNGGVSWYWHAAMVSNHCGPESETRLRKKA